MRVPPLSERREPGLSVTLTGPKHPGRCQSCGHEADPTDGIALSVWIECDEWDRPTSPPVYVVLCTVCRIELIDAHPRLYHQAEHNAPLLGVMHLCVDCRFRDGVRCTNPTSRQNGGEGMAVVHDREPVRAHVRGRGFSGFRTLYHGPPRSCGGREEVSA